MSILRPNASRATLRRPCLQRTQGPPLTAQPLSASTLAPTVDARSILSDVVPLSQEMIQTSVVRRGIWRMASDLR